MAVLFSDFRTQWREDVLLFGRASTRTVRDSHMRLIAKHFAGKTLEEVAAPAAAQSLVRTLSLSQLPKSVNNVWGTLRAALHYARRQGLIVAVPEPDLPKKSFRPGKFLLPEQMHQLIRHSVGKEQAFHALLCETGLRIGEARGLHASDIRGTVLTVNKSMWRADLQDPKTRASFRSITISVQLTRLLQPWIVPGAAIFPVSLTTTSKRLKSACAKAGIPEVSHHVLRHSNKSLLYILERDKVVRDIRLGHALQGMDGVYIHPTQLMDGPCVEALAEILYKGVKI